MKKILKVFSSLCLVLVVGAAVLLSGCAKKYNVNVQATVGGGVYARGTNSVSVIGDNEVEQGKDFQISIEANPGYYIQKLTVNGKAVDISTWAADSDGYVTRHVYAVSKVEEDKNVVITFGAKIKNIKFVFVNSSYASIANESYLEYKVPCHKDFNLFKFDFDGTGAGEAEDIFYMKRPDASYVALSKFALNSVNGTLYVKLKDGYTGTGVMDQIQSDLDAIITAVEGCERIYPAA